MTAEAGEAIVENFSRGDFIATLTLSIAIGALLTAIARRLDLPAIVLLLAGGVIAGPQVLGLIAPSALGQSLEIIVAFSIGIILFEGGLTLDKAGYRSASSLIQRLLTVGVAVTWLGGALAIFLIFQTSITFALLAASLTIVTGPTVISPLLKRIRLKPNLHHVLHWEGVLIDPIGVFIAILCFELVVKDLGEAAWSNLAMRIGLGIFIGLIGGWLIAFIMKRRWIPEDLINVFTFGFAAFIFGTTETFKAEAGLLAVTVCGLTMGMIGVPALKKIRQFKADIVDLLIGMLFILLSARLEWQQFVEFGWLGLFLVAVFIFMVRPAAIFLCSTGLEMTWREKLFLSWVAPRGIVAASIASLFTLALQGSDGVQNPRFLESFTYAVIVCTIVLQGFSANGVARLLKLQQPPPQGWLIAGAHSFSRIIAGWLMESAKLKVLLVDGNRKAVAEAREAGYRAIYTDAREVETIEQRGELAGVGKLLALTDNEDLNALLCQRWAEPFTNNSVYRWHSGKGDNQQAEDEPWGKIIWVRLPKPSLIVTELENGQAKLVRGKFDPSREQQQPGEEGGEEQRKDQATGEKESKEDVEQLKLPVRPLMATINGQLVMDPTREELQQAARDGSQLRWLSLQREADYLLGALDRKLVVDVGDAQEPEEVIRRLVHRIAERENLLDEEKLLDEILAREKTHPTLLGHGVAVPQAVVDGLHHRSCALARIPNGLRYMSDSPEEVQLVFLLLSPSGHRERHLATLGEIARMASHYEARERLIQAKDAEEILNIIREYRPLRLQSDEETKWPQAIKQRGERRPDEEPTRVSTSTSTGNGSNGKKSSQEEKPGNGKK